MSEVIERVLEHATRPWDDPDKVIEQMSGQLGTLELRQKRLLPAEHSAGLRIGGELARLRRERNQAAAYAKIGLPRLDFEPLRWRQSKLVSWRRRAIQVPRLALVPVHEPQVVFYCRWDVDEPPRGYTRELSGLYEDVMGDLERIRGNGSGSARLTYEYPGALPEDARETIAEAALSRRFDALYLLAETQPEEWALHTERPPREWLADPLILGLKADALWVLGMFDPTPVEQYVNAEFTLAPAAQKALR